MSAENNMVQLLYYEADGEPQSVIVELEFSDEPAGDDGMKPLTFEFSDEDYDRFEACANDRGMTVEELVTEAIYLTLDIAEDMELEMKAVAVT